MPKFKLGDVVKMRSGGPLMVVTDPDSEKCDDVACIFVSRTHGPLYPVVPAYALELYVPQELGGPETMSG